VDLGTVDHKEKVWDDEDGSRKKKEGDHEMSRRLL
jgi:hypothetical protein